MDKIDKFLNKLLINKRKEIQRIVKKITEKDFTDLDIKKLKGLDNMFRVRKGDVRIIFLVENDYVEIIDLQNRNDKTYSKL